MKKIIAILLTFLLCCTPLAVGASAKAQEAKDDAAEEASQQTAAQPVVEVTEDRSTPRLMVTDYSLDTEYLTPGKASILKITFHNYSATKSLRNIKLTLTDDSGEIEITGMPTEYLNRIYVGKDYVWEVELTAVETASVGKHRLTISSEYEDLYFSAFSSSDAITLDVRQSISLDYSGITMPDKIVESETNTMTVTLMNTGKTDIRNCKLTFTSDTLESSGTTFVGEISAGESAETKLNYKAPEDTVGKVSATVTITYEDPYGKEKSKKVKLSTIAEEKVEVAQKVEEEEKSGNSLWWLFILLGAAVGGGLGYGVPTTLRARKERLEDEKRL